MAIPDVARQIFRQHAQLAHQHNQILLNGRQMAGDEIIRGRGAGQPQRGVQLIHRAARLNARMRFGTRRPNISAVVPASPVLVTMLIGKITNDLNPITKACPKRNVEWLSGHSHLEFVHQAIIGSVGVPPGCARWRAVQKSANKLPRHCHSLPPATLNCASIHFRQNIFRAIRQQAAQAVFRRRLQLSP